VNDTTVNTHRFIKVVAVELATKEILDIGLLIAEKARTRARVRAQALLKSAPVKVDIVVVNKVDSFVVDRKGKVVGRAG